jgi:peroxiredoxin
MMDSRYGGWWRGFAAPLVFGMVFVVGGCGRDGASPEPAVPVGTEVGEQAPPLAGTRPGGGEYTLGRERGRSTAVVFLRGFDCGLCRERLRLLQASHPEYERAGARVVAVTPVEDGDAGAAAQDLGLSFPLVQVDSGTFARWGLIDDGSGLPLPASYLLDPQGVIVYRHVGRNAADRARDIELLAALEQLRAGR